MPISPEFRKFYGREWRTVTRPAILARARNRCEQCGAPNTQILLRSAGGMWRLRACGAPWHRSNGRITTFSPMGWHDVRIVVTIAHLNHTPGDDRPENLKALCQWCHLNYDKLHHKESRSLRKDRARPLLATSEAGMLPITPVALAQKDA